MLAQKHQNNKTFYFPLKQVMNSCRFCGASQLHLSRVSHTFRTCTNESCHLLQQSLRFLMEFTFYHFEIGIKVVILCCFLSISLCCCRRNKWMSRVTLLEIKVLMDGYKTNKASRKNRVKGKHQPSELQHIEGGGECRGGGAAAWPTGRPPDPTSWTMSYTP